MKRKSKRGMRSRRRLPGRFVEFGNKYPSIMSAYEALGAATQKAGPLTLRERTLVKLAIAVGARLEGAVHSHARRALEVGCTPEEIRHVVLLAATTVGFPSMMAALSWVDDILGGGS